MDKSVHNTRLWAVDVLILPLILLWVNIDTNIDTRGCPIALLWVIDDRGAGQFLGPRLRHIDLRTRVRREDELGLLLGTIESGISVFAVGAGGDEIPEFRVVEAVVDVRLELEAFSSFPFVVPVVRSFVYLDLSPCDGQETIIR